VNTGPASLVRMSFSMTVQQLADTIAGKPNATLGDVSDALALVGAGGDPALLAQLVTTPVKPKPDLSDEVVIVDGGVVKRSPWSAFKARIAVWLTDLEAVWSKKTLADPKVQGLISFDVRDDAAERVSLQAFRASNGNLSFRLTKSDGSQFFVINQNGGPAYTGRFGFTMEETTGVGRIQVFSPSGNTGITLQPQGTGSVNVGGSGGLTVAGVPVVTTTGVQSISNKTLSAPTLDSPIVNSPSMKNAANDGQFRVRNAVNGKTVFQVDQVDDAVNGFSINGSTSATKTPQLRAFGDDADVGIRLVPKGEGEIFAGTALDRVSVKRNAIPTSATDVGKPGWWAEDDNWLYVYIGDGTAHAWRRAALQTW
jgi:hypothetical protein